jgi:glyoxylase-like metal-dependent hydrolase (beta-lactamase superfamily II)
MKVAIVPVTPYEQNCSLWKCEETGKIAIVDPGGDLDKIKAAIKQLGGTPEVIFLTHGHLDHCSMARVLANDLGVKIIGPNKGDDYWIAQLPKQATMIGIHNLQAWTPDQWLNDGDVVQFGKQKLEVIQCPGHTPGHVVFYHRGEKLAAVGDVIFKDSVGRTDLPGGDWDTLENSIKQKLFPLGGDITFIPGHGPVSTFGEERISNPYVGLNPIE